MSLKRVLERDASTYKRLRVTWMRTTYGRVEFLNFERNFYTKFDKKKKFLWLKLFWKFPHVSSAIFHLSLSRLFQVDWICKQNFWRSCGWWLGKTFWWGVTDAFEEIKKINVEFFFWGWRGKFYFWFFFSLYFANFLLKVSLGLLYV